MSQPAQTFAFNVSYYIFISNCIFQFLICFESPLSICLLCWLFIYLLIYIYIYLFVCLGTKSLS
jgi:hypothetical protein